MKQSPLNPGLSPVSIHYRDAGQGPPLFFLHGCWGYAIYPFGAQNLVFSRRFRIIIPDRSGYGRSSTVAELPIDYHQRAAAETIAMLDALEIERAIFWGHSDGAVIAAMVALAAPERCTALVLESFHYRRNKEHSRQFFMDMINNPLRFGPYNMAVLAADHGEQWRAVLERAGRAWLSIIDASAGTNENLYDGRLGELKTPALFLHGSLDPRTEPGELETVQALLPQARFEILAGAGHSPHSSKLSSTTCNRLASEFFKSIL